MRAAFYEHTGPAEAVLQVGDVEAAPAPGPGEVRVRLAASGVNPSDVKLRAGLRPGVGTDLPYPRIIPHGDGAGTIEDVGADVPASRLGQRVWVWNGQWQRAFGTAAERIVLPAAQAVPLDDGASFADGACLGIPALTAQACLDAVGPVSGRWVLVTGGAGRVGHYAVALAAAAGARVVSTAGSPEKRQAARAAGAEAAIDYRSEGAAETILEVTGGGVDAAIDGEFGPNLPLTAAVIRPAGTIAAYGSAGNMTPTLPFGTLMFKSITLRTLLVYDLGEDQRSRAIAGLTRALAAGVLRHRIAHRFPLTETAQAHIAVESAHRPGAVIIDID